MQMVAIIHVALVGICCGDQRYIRPGCLRGYQSAALHSDGEQRLVVCLQTSMAIHVEVCSVNTVLGADFITVLV